MADYYRERDEIIPDGMRTMYQEVGHECHGEVVATNEVWRVQEVYNAAANDVGVKNRKVYIVPDHHEVQVLWIGATVTTTATVGNRQIQIAAYRQDGTLIGVLATAGAVQAAGTTRFYTFAPGLADLTAFRDTNCLTTPLPTGTIGRQQQRLVVFDNKNIDPLDNVVLAVQVAVRAVSN